MSENTPYQKTEEQLGEAKIAENDPTLKLNNRIQKILCRLRKEKKFTGREYFQIYLSDPIPPRLHGAVKAHNTVKNYPMRTNVPTIETSAYGISKYLVEINQPTLSKINNKVRNSKSRSKTMENGTKPAEVQLPYHVVNLHPSVPSLNLTDIHQLPENLGPIGLSIMVII